MGKLLIIAEKPSVMTDLSKTLTQVLGKFEKVGAARDVYFENDAAIITSAVGHLVELRMPTAANGKKLPWSFEVLPAIPQQFELQPIEENEKRLNQILKFAKRKDVETIINACDAGREGELIFRYIIEIGNIQKPTKRIWMQSMTHQAILQAWEKIRDGSEMQPLADAAKCRSESDWLIGLNATRALTCFRSRHGGFNITAAGRVQTPTLAILASREAEILSFQSRNYWEVNALFPVAAGSYPGKWIDSAFKKEKDDAHARPERIWDAALAETIRARCQNQPATIEEETKSQTTIAPQLYDLTTLQREAPFSAKQTLSIAQALYEKHKMVTYPRTDSRYLPEDYLDTVRETLSELANSDLPQAEYARDVLEQQKGAKLTQNKRIFNNAKVSDHFAIIPTGKIAKLSDAEHKLYDMIVKRFIAVFFPSAEFLLTKRQTTVTSTKDVFLTNGRVMTYAGWQEVYGRQVGVAAGKDELIPISPKETTKATELEVLALETKPPARYTEATLLSAMEGAGKLVEDEALREAMSERGLGTPATRAAIIEGLLAQKYIARNARDLHVSPNGMRLIEIVKLMGIEGLSSPQLTGDWEYKLRQMEQGQLDRSTFMREIISYTSDIVNKARSFADTLQNREFPDLQAPCPICGAAALKQTDATYECREIDCKFKAKKHIAGRVLSPEEAKTLFTTKFLPKVTGFKSRFNKDFDAALELDDKFKINFVFDSDKDDEQAELTEDQFLTTLTLMDGKEYRVFQTEKFYMIPERITKKDARGVKIARTILQRSLSEQDLRALLQEGKTPLLKGFISNRTKRGFDAHLTFDAETGAVGFEFAPRAPKKSDASGETATAAPKPATKGKTTPKPRKKA